MNEHAETAAVLADSGDAKLHFRSYGADSFRFDSAVLQMKGAGKSRFLNELGELLEKYRNAVGAEGNWRRLKVLHTGGPNGSSTFPGGSVPAQPGRYDVGDAYLQSRLQNVSQVRVFYVAVRPEMWDCCAALTDPMEKYLFSRALGACFDQGLEKLIPDLTRALPRGAKLFMDNPGVDGQWSMSGQLPVFRLLFRENAGEMAEKFLRPDGSFRNPYSMTGIIFTTSRKNSLRPDIHYMNGSELVNVLYRSAGLIADTNGEILPV